MIWNGRDTVGCIGVAGALIVGCGGVDTFDELFAPGASVGRAIDAGANSDGWTLPPSDGWTLPPSSDAARAASDAREGASEDASDGAPPGDSSALPPDAGPWQPEASMDAAGPEVVDALVSREAGEDAAPGPADPLRRQRWEVKCTSGPLASDMRLCSSLASGQTACPANHRPTDKHITFGGRPGIRYLVTLRLRGVVELKRYEGGTAAASHFLIGGNSPPDVVNAFGMTVSSPAQTYYVNADHVGGGQVTAALDDTVTIVVDAGAIIALFATDSDCVQLRNCVDATAAMCTPYVIPDVPPAPRHFDGQFAQVDVVSVVMQPHP
jgi:hypothetical protein